MTPEQKIANLEAECARLKGENGRLKAALSQVDDVLVVNWVGPRVDRDYRRALADLVATNLMEAEFFAKQEHGEIAALLGLPPDIRPEVLIAKVLELVERAKR